MRTLTDPAHTGAAVIALPQDVQGETFDYPAEFFAKRVHKLTRPLPVKEELDEGVAAITAAKKPLLIVGGGVRYSEAGEAARAFCEEFNIPFAETQAGKSAIPSSHPLNAGGIGVTGNSAANELVRQSDLVIAVGTRFTDFTTGSKELFADKKVLTLNASSFHGGKLEAVKMTCDAKAGLEILKIALGDYKSAWGEEIEKARQGWKKEYKRLASLVINEESEGEIGSKMPDAIRGFIKAHGGAMAQTAAIAAVREEIPEDAVIVGSAGSLPGDLQRMWTTDEKDAYNMEYGYSCMGYEIAGALGSKLAEPGKEVYAMVGDGSFFMLHSELVTALQERVKINVLLFDNASFGCINNLQMEQGVDALCTELRYRDGDKPVRGGEFMNVDFAKVAEGYGCKSYTARTIEELRAALRDSLKQSVSTLIDIKVAPKTMTHGYDGWWNVGVTQAPRTEKQKKALKEREEHLLRARKY